MSSAGLFESLYRFFSTRRGILYISFLGVIALSIAGFENIHLSENIAAMLPKDQMGETGHFKLLQQAPFSRKLIVNLKRNPGVEKDVLIETAGRLARALKGPFFTSIVTGPDETAGDRLFSWMIQALPSLATDEDMSEIRQRLLPENMKIRLQDLYERLLTPEGWIIKTLIQTDPLGFREIGFKKLSAVKLIPRMRIENGHFISADGMNALMIIETPLAITDSGGSVKLIEAFNRAVRNNVSDGIEVTLIGGHIYSAANAQTIKRDILVILGCSSLALVTLFFVFLRSWRAFFVFLVPVSVLCIASVGVSLFYGEVSAITIGFGSVLLGISVDFALHVYFALRNEKTDPGRTTGQVSSPVIFGGLTTIGAFSVLLFSKLPGQQQLAIFSMIGMISAILVALGILPHLIKGGRKPERVEVWEWQVLKNNHFIWILAVWVMVSAFCVFQAGNLRIDGDLRSLNLVSPEIKAAESRLKSTWGDIRGSAMIFVQGRDLEEALNNNDRLYAFLTTQLPDSKMVSLSPILPSRTTQIENLERWRSFWSPEKKRDLQKRLITGSEVHGFSDNAFLPFFEVLDQPTRPIDVADLGKAGLDSIVSSLVIQSEGHPSVRILTLLPDTQQARKLMTTIEKDHDAQFVSHSRFNTEVGSLIRDDFIRFILRASIVVILLLFILFRNPKHVLCALIPVVSGLVFMFGMMGWLGINFNLFNIVAAILVIGLGVDYGIFVVMKIINDYRHNTDLAVLVSGLTTLAGFGALVLARHPALSSIGITVLLGISAAIPSALFVIPVFYRNQGLNQSPGE